MQPCLKLLPPHQPTTWSPLCVAGRHAVRARRALAQESPHTAPRTLKRQEHNRHRCTQCTAQHKHTKTHSLTHLHLCRTRSTRTQQCTLTLHVCARSRRPVLSNPQDVLHGIPALHVWSSGLRCQPSLSLREFSQCRLLLMIESECEPEIAHLSWIRHHLAQSLHAELHVKSPT